MKTAISIPDPLFQNIESFLKTARISRSEFFQRAARDYLDKICGKAIVKNLNEVYGGEEDAQDIAFRRAALAHLRGRILDQEEW